MRCLLGCLGFCLTVMSVACGGTDEGELLVDVRTDLQAGREFASIRVELFSQPPGSGDAAIRREETPVRDLETLGAAKRAAEFDALPEGEYFVAVTLLTTAGERVVERITHEVVKGTTITTVFVTRDCREVSCTGADPERRGITCLNGLCEDPRCGPEREGLCLNPRCTAAEGCAEGASCAPPECVQGVCLREAVADACEGGASCDPDTGCVAGMADGGGDAAPDAAPDGGTDASSPACDEPECWYQAQYAKGEDPVAGAKLGGAVSLSGDGTVVALGADSHPMDDQPRVGAVTVLRRVDDQWIQEAWLRHGHPDAHDAFGYDVALSADGSTLAVGAYGESGGDTHIGGDESDNALSRSGAVFVYRHGPDGWSQSAYVKAPNPDPDDFFGVAVALSADGSVLAVGANHEDSGSEANPANNDLADAGAVYVYVREGDTWTHDGYLKVTNPGAGDAMGFPVVLSADGQVLVAGANQEDSAATGTRSIVWDDDSPNAGAAYVFRRTADRWTSEAVLKPSVNHEGAFFGTALSLTPDGRTLSVGAVYESAQIDVAGVPFEVFYAGAVYVFRRIGVRWEEEARLTASNVELVGFGEHFGHSVAISADGTTLSVGTPHDNSSASGINGNPFDRSAAESGAVFVFDRVDGTWTEQYYVKASNPGTSDRFGQAVALADDGRTLVIGAGQEDGSSETAAFDVSDDALEDSGAAYIFRRLPP